MRCGRRCCTRRCGRSSCSRRSTAWSSRCCERAARPHAVGPCRARRRPPPRRRQPASIPRVHGDVPDDGGAAVGDGAALGRRDVRTARTPTTFALQDAMAALEGGGRCVLLPSGLAAVTTALLALLDAGDHLLMVDTVYGPTRVFCDRALRSLGVGTTYYAPDADVAPLLRENTRAVFLESPGVAHVRGAGRARRRRRRAGARGVDADGQHLGDAAAVQAAGAGRGRVDPVPDQVRGRSRGPDDGRGHRRRRGVRAHPRHRRAIGAVRRG